MKKTRFTISPNQSPKSPTKKRRSDKSSVLPDDSNNSFWDKVSKFQDDSAKSTKSQKTVIQAIEEEDEEDIDEFFPNMKLDENDLKEKEDLKKLPRAQLEIVFQAELDYHNMKIRELAQIIEKQMTDTN